MSTEPLKSAFLIMVNNRRLGRAPSTTLSIGQHFYPAENVKVLRSTLVMFYRAWAAVVNALV